ncbi:MAG: 1-deoxy-D-xylulose-5-phosphate reductoisomerase [Gaiellales bacterium]|nr:1-deoxy-D-xylulose-5-phosphate reductoisomerase [Gaiellales bacterium]
MKRIAILGATGSIGTQALDVVAAHDDLEVVALAAGSDVEGLVAAARATGAEVLALADPAAAERAAVELGRPVLSGPRALVELIDAAGATVVLNAVVGAAGLEASLDTLERGLDLALANKESLVAGGELVLAAARRGGGAILPVDSEHSALQQCLGELPREQLSSLVITASGGPFRGRTRAELAEITVAQALAHPTWAMGAKITVDSATLMNKGLEVIEAHMLFDLPFDQIEVVVHPQSIVHGMARLRDGALIAHLGHPDMRVPISFALTYPERAAVPARPLEWTEAFALDFEPPDLETFGCLRLAIAAGEAGGTAPAVLNAANEVAVAAFLTGEIGFLEIEALVDDALQHVPVQPLDDLAAVLAADGAARTRVAARIAEVGA